MVSIVIVEEFAWAWFARIVVLSLDYTIGTIPTTRKRAVANALALNQRVAERASETLLHYCFESLLSPQKTEVLRQGTDTMLK